MADDIVRAAADLAVLVDDRGRIEEVHFGEPYAGERGDEWVGRSWADIVTGATRHKVEQLLDEARQEGVSRWRQVNHELPSGREVPVRYTTVRLGQSGKILAIGRDLGSLSQLQSRLVEAQQAMERDYWRMRHIETRYRLLFQSSSEVVFLVHAETGEVLDANPAAAEFLGSTVQDVVGRAFPVSIAGHKRRELEEHLAAVRARGDADPVRITVDASGDGPAGNYELRASLMRQDEVPTYLVRIRRVGDAAPSPRSQARAEAMRLLRDVPDGIVVTDASGAIVDANETFVEMAQMPGREPVVGENIERWLGLPGSEGNVLFAMLEAHGVLRLFPTMLSGELGSRTEVEVSAVLKRDADPPAAVFIIRDVARRLAGRREIAGHLEAVVEQFTDLVGRVTLKELVKDTVAVVEREFIESALGATGGNRTAAAELLGLSRQSLYAKLDRYEVSDENGNGGGSG